MVNDDSDECSEGEGTDEIVVVDLDVEKNELHFEEGDFILVEYKEQRGGKVFYVCKVLGMADDTVMVSSLRKNPEMYKFHHPNNPDINTVEKSAIKFVLPKPGSLGGTARQKASYIFHQVIFPQNITVR